MRIYINQSKPHYTLEDSNIQVKNNINMITKRLMPKTSKYIKEFSNLQKLYEDNTRRTGLMTDWCQSTQDWYVYTWSNSTKTM